LHLRGMLPVLLDQQLKSRRHCILVRFPLQGKEFFIVSKTYRSARVIMQTTTQLQTVAVFLGGGVLSGWDVELTSNVLLIPWLRIHGDITPLPCASNTWAGTTVFLLLCCYWFCQQ
jgi:hypothetical protein